MRHVKHLLVAVLILAAVLAGAVLALNQLVPETFKSHENGWQYRHASLVEKATSPPVTYASAKTCMQPDCHGENAEREELKVALGGGHEEICCQSCHGPAQVHVASEGEKEPPVILEAEAQAEPPEGMDPWQKIEFLQKQMGTEAKALLPFCLKCHFVKPGMPEDFDIIDDVQAHREEFGTGDETGCTVCHDYHTCETD